MATIGFKRLTGQEDVRTLLVDSGSVIEIGDIVSTDESAGDLIIGATNIANTGIALEASADSSTTAIRYDRLTPGTIWRARVETGTMLITFKGKFANINTQDGITIDTTTNEDCRIIDWNGVDGFADIEFTTTTQLGPDTA